MIIVAVLLAGFWFLKRAQTFKAGLGVALITLVLLSIAIVSGP